MTGSFLPGYIPPIPPNPVQETAQDVMIRQNANQIRLLESIRTALIIIAVLLVLPILFGFLVVVVR